MALMAARGEWVPLDQPPAWKLQFFRRLHQIRWEEEMEDLAVFMEKLSTEMKNVDKNAALVRIGGSSARLLGRVMVLSGAVATFFTAGLAAPLAVTGVVMCTAGLATSSGSEITKHRIVLHRASEAREMLLSRADLFESIQEVFESVITEVDGLSRMERERHKGIAGTMKDVVQHISTLLVMIKETATALGGALAGKTRCERGGAVESVSKDWAMEGAAAAANQVAAFLVPVDDLLGATHIYFNGGKSEGSFQSIARTVRAIMRVMKEFENEMNQEPNQLATGDVG